MPQTPKLALMAGLPKAGKTTYARALQEQGWVRISPDDIRQALHKGAFHPPAEDFVWATARLATRALLLGGHRVVIDATHTTRKRRGLWVAMGEELDVPVYAFVMQADVETCHERNRALRSPIPSDVIDRMAAQWEPVEEHGIVACDVQ